MASSPGPGQLLSPHSHSGKAELTISFLFYSVLVHSSLRPTSRARASALYVHASCEVGRVGLLERGDLAGLAPWQQSSPVPDSLLLAFVLAKSLKALNKQRVW